MAPPWGSELGKAAGKAPWERFPGKGSLGAPLLLLPGHRWVMKGDLSLSHVATHARSKSNKKILVRENLAPGIQLSRASYRHQRNEIMGAHTNKKFQGDEFMFHRCYKGWKDLSVFPCISFKILLQNMNPPPFKSHISSSPEPCHLPVKIQTALIIILRARSKFKDFLQIRGVI